MADIPALRRYRQSEEIAEAIVFIASDKASYLAVFGSQSYLGWLATVGRNS